MRIAFNKDLIICRSCDQKVVWSAYATHCVNCGKKDWGYTARELEKAATARHTHELKELSCQACGNINSSPLSDVCTFCDAPKWGYNDFELQYGLFPPAQKREIAGQAPALPPPLLPAVNGRKHSEAMETGADTNIAPGEPVEADQRRPRLKTILSVIAAGIFIGGLLSFLITVLLYQRYERSIGNSKAATSIFKNDPVLNYQLNMGRESRVYNDSLFSWRLLVNMGVLDWKSDPSDCSPALVQALAGLQEAMLRGDKNVDILYSVLENLGKKKNSLSNQSGRTEKEILIHCLAGGPDARTELQGLQSGTPALSKCYYWQFLLPFDAWHEKTTVQDFLASIMHATWADHAYQDLSPAGENKGPLDPKDEYTQITDFLLRLIISVNNDAGVQSAKNAFAIFVGTEQFFMYLIFGIGLMILIKNFRYNRDRKKGIGFNEGNRKFTVVVYKWIHIALPSIGFIGTKRGLSSALSESHIIVEATTGVGQSLAVSEVSDKMGIAFTSTLVGLSLLMLLMLFELCLRYLNTKWDE